MTITGFPLCLNVKVSCETFCKPKWLKAKKQLPFHKSENPQQISFGY